MNTKLNQKPENKRQFHAFEVYRDLGYGRTFQEVHRQTGYATQTICRWAQSYDWAGRLAKYNEIVAEKKADGMLMKMDDPTLQKIVTVMEQMEALINSAFVRDDNGKISPTIKIRNADELIKLLAEERKFLETYHRFVAEFKPAKKEKDKGTQIQQVNQYFGSISQEERINALKGIMPNGDDTGRDKQSTGDVQDADYTEVSGRGDDD